MNYLTITQVNTLAKQTLEQYSVWIKGEISESSPDKYYYKYITLKDENSCISCVIPSSKVQMLGFKIEVGITIRAFGKLSIYERDGRYQFKAEILEKDGEGDLQAKIEEIKGRLQKEGLLDQSRKRQLPEFPQRVAVITSFDSAAWKDFYKIINERYPCIEILAYDALVQGEKAPQDIIKGLKQINSIKDIDLIVITRGGGSLEDLMAFNDEILAREVAASRYPVVSAVGHEKDISIIDLVADLRASTPSNAAELIAPHKDTIYQGLDSIKAKMEKWSENQLRIQELNLSTIVGRSEITDKDKFFRRFSQQLEFYTGKILINRKIYSEYGSSLDNIKCCLELSVKKLIEDKSEKADDKFCDLKVISQKIMDSHSREVEKIELQIQLNNPLQILKKGYSIMTDSKGTVIKSIKEANKGETTFTRLEDGIIKSTILDTIKDG